MNINERLSLLRKAMKTHGIDAYIMPTSDPHQSEYVADCWKSRTWISGFTGSAGTVVVTQDHAGLWTDSRYFIQAEQQLSNSEFVLHKFASPGDQNYDAWLSETLSKGQKIGFDGLLFSHNQAKGIKDLLSSKGIETNADLDLMTETWSDRPTMPKNKVFEHELRYTGLSRIEKLDIIRKKMNSKSASSHFVSTLDDIAWILNIRSNDVDCNPVAIAYLVVNEEDAYLFIDKEKITDDFQQLLEEDQIYIHPYESISDYLANSQNILIDPDLCSTYLYGCIDSNQVIKGDTPSRLLKAIKNDVEMAHIKQVMAKDGAALTQFFIWLEDNIENGLTEFEVGEKLAYFRGKQALYFGESFEPIVGFKGNGAIVHYRAPEQGSAVLSKDGMILIDSGGQYHDGTTDITRTVHYGTPTKEEIRNFTLVLKGHIALAEIVYPEGTCGANLDTLARQFLWKERLNYLHGTGHGVGFFLNVHEPPQGFTAGLTTRSTTVLEHGMFTSNEPGFYKKDAYGIRIENLVLTVKDEVKGFLKHETMTYFPIQKSLIEKSLLDDNELMWLDEYHKEVYDAIAPLVNEKEKEWLKQQCKA